MCNYGVFLFVKTLHFSSWKIVVCIDYLINVSRETILSIWPRLKEYSPDVYEEVEIETKYSGYIKRQLADIEVFKKDEKLKIRDDINYAEIGGLSNEMVAKLSRVRPATIGEASRISGVTPAAIMAILGHLKK